MCVDHRMICKCGGNEVSLNFRDEVLPSEVVEGLYCPKCSGGITFDPERMLNDNGWVLAFDMEIADFMKNKLPAVPLSPEMIFDEGYCTWRGMYPKDNEDSLREREELVRLAKVNKHKYLEEFRKWSLNRMDRIAREGWRKASEKR